MYSEYLGENYCDKIRKMLVVNESFMPDRIINADANIGGIKALLAPALENLTTNAIDTINTEEKFKQLQTIGIYYLSGILCMVAKSRSSVPPYNTSTYRKNWEKKQKGYMEKGNLIMRGLIKSEH